MAQPRGFGFNASYFDRAKGGMAFRSPLSGLSGSTPDLSNVNASALAGTGSSHAGQSLNGNDNGTDPLASALTGTGLSILRNTPTSIYKTPDEEEQYYQDSIRRLNDAASQAYKQADERAVASGLVHSGALVGEYGDIGERLVQGTGEQLRALKKEDREFADQSLVNRTGLAANIQGQLAGQKVATAGLMGFDENGNPTEQARQFDVSQSGLLDGQKTLTAKGQEADIGLRQQAQALADRIQSGQLSIAQAAQQLDSKVRTGELSIAQADQILRQAQLGETQRQFNIGAYGYDPNQAAPGTVSGLGAGQPQGVPIPGYGPPPINGRAAAAEAGAVPGVLSSTGTGTGLAGPPLTLAAQKMQADIAATQADTKIRQDAQALADRIQNGQLSIAQAAQQLDSKVRTGELSIAQRDQILRQVELFGKAVGMSGQVDKFGIPIPVSTYLGVQGGLETLGGKQQSNQDDIAKLNNAIAVGQQTGKFTDPFSGITFTTQEALQRAFNNRITEAGLMGQMPLYNSDGTPALDPVTKQQKMGTTLDAQRLGLQTAEVFGKSGLIAAGTETLTARGQAADIAARNRQLSQAEQEMYGGATIKNPDGTTTFYPTLKAQLQTATLTGKVIDPMGGKNPDGTPKLIDTQQALNDAIDRAAKQGAATGQYKDPVTGATRDTLAKKQVDNQVTQFAQELGLNQQKVNLGVQQFAASVSPAMRSFALTAQSYRLDANGNPIAMADGTPMTAADKAAYDKATADFLTAYSDAEDTANKNFELQKQNIDAQKELQKQTMILNAAIAFMGTKAGGNLVDAGLDALLRFAGYEMKDGKITKIVKKDDSPVKKDDSPVKKDDSPVKKDDSPVKKDDSPVKKDDVVPGLVTGTVLTVAAIKKMDPNWSDQDAQSLSNYMAKHNVTKTDDPAFWETYFDWADQQSGRGPSTTSRSDGSPPTGSALDKMRKDSNGQAVDLGTYGGRGVFEGNNGMQYYNDGSLVFDPYGNPIPAPFPDDATPSWDSPEARRLSLQVGPGFEISNLMDFNQGLMTDTPDSVKGYLATLAKQYGPIAAANTAYSMFKNIAKGNWEGVLAEMPNLAADAAKFSTLFALPSGPAMAAFMAGMFIRSLADWPTESYRPGQLLGNPGSLSNILEYAKQNKGKPDTVWGGNADLNGDGIIGDDDIRNLQEQFDGMMRNGQPAGKVTVSGLSSGMEQAAAPGSLKDASSGMIYMGGAGKPTVVVAGNRKLNVLNNGQVFDGGILVGKTDGFTLLFQDGRTIPLASGAGEPPASTPTGLAAPPPAQHASGIAAPATLSHTAEPNAPRFFSSGLPPGIQTRMILNGKRYDVMDNGFMIDPQTGQSPGRVTHNSFDPNSGTGVFIAGNQITGFMIMGNDDVVSATGNIIGQWDNASRTIRMSDGRAIGGF